MTEVELELTYLAKSLPKGLAKCPSKIIKDIYLPAEAVHPVLRLRQNGDKFQITKKLMASGTDSSHMIEETIHLSQTEFEALAVSEGKRVVKRRYDYDYEGEKFEIDVFEEDLTGLVVIDIEFTDRQKQLQFKMPDFCLTEVTQETFMAGGVLAGKSYSNIAPQLAKYNYKALQLKQED